MLAIFISVAAAILFGLSAFTLLGTDGLVVNAWVDIVFWTLIGVGVAIAAINVNWSCTGCVVARRLRRHTLIARFCDKPPCPN